MRKKVLALVLVAALVFALAGCSLFAKKEGGIGDTLSTRWFDFTVDSVDVVNSYAGITAEPGYKLVDIVVTETSTVEDDLPMGWFDFMLDDPADEDYYQLPLEQADSSMMPEEFTLTAKETVTYHLLFEVDESSSKLALVFTEYFSDEDTGDTFTVNFTV